MEKFSLTDIRKKNYADIYKLIYQEKRISKQQIATALQMSLPTVTQHLTALADDGLIEKRGQLSSNIGRKAAAYQSKADARVAVGVEVLSDQVTVVVLDLYGAVIQKKTVSLFFSQEDSYFSALADLVNALLKECGIPEERVLGVGIGMQGLVSKDGREMIYGKILDCTGLKIDALEQYLNYPCRFIHDSECAANLELWRDPALVDAVYLSLGRHLGGAVISDGQIQNGRTGRSGTFEHMTLMQGGRQCYCGKQGCMECYCSANALLKAGETPESFFSALRRNSFDHNSRWVEYLGWLALALNNIHMVIDSVIVLGGRIGPFLTEDDLAMLFSLIQLRTAFPEQQTFLRLGVQEAGVVAIGAAIPYIRGFLSSVG